MQFPEGLDLEDSPFIKNTFTTMVSGDIFLSPIQFSKIHLRTYIVLIKYIMHINKSQIFDCNFIEDLALLCLYIYCKLKKTTVYLFSCRNKKSKAESCVSSPNFRIRV